MTKAFSISEQRETFFIFLPDFVWGARYVKREKTNRNWVLKYSWEILMRYPLLYVLNVHTLYYSELVTSSTPKADPLKCENRKKAERWNKVVQNKLRPAETETHSQPDECLNKLLFTQNIYSFVSVMSLFVEQTVFTIVTHFKFLVRDTKQELDLLPLHFLTLCTFTKQIILVLHSSKYNREMEQRGKNH